MKTKTNRPTGASWAKASERRIVQLTLTKDEHADLRAAADVSRQSMTQLANQIVIREIRKILAKSAKSP